MVYNFDINVAKEYGVNEAIMIANLQFWIAKNKANGRNFKDGHYWTYNSKRALLELFPFWSEQNIKTILEHLKNKNVLITANHNTNQYDRTLWYAFVDEDRWLSEVKDPNLSKSEAHPIHWLESTNGKVETNQPIPDNKPDNKPDKKEKNTVNSVYKEKDQPKRSWGEFGTVKLTEEEFVKIVEKYGWYTEFAVEKLDGYIATHGDPYKRHYPVFKRGNWIWDEAFKNRENGLPPIHNTIIDPSSPTGARAQTALEYYTDKYGLGKQQGKENNDVREKDDMHIPG